MKYNHAKSLLDDLTGAGLTTGMKRKDKASYMKQLKGGVSNEDKANLYNTAVGLASQYVSKIPVAGAVFDKLIPKINYPSKDELRQAYARKAKVGMEDVYKVVGNYQNMFAKIANTALIGSPDSLWNTYKTGGETKVVQSKSLTPENKKKITDTFARDKKNIKYSGTNNTAPSLLQKYRIAIHNLWTRGQSDEFGNNFNKIISENPETDIYDAIARAGDENPVVPDIVYKEYQPNQFQTQRVSNVIQQQKIDKEADAQNEENFKQTLAKEGLLQNVVQPSVLTAITGQTGLPTGSGRRKKVYDLFA